MLSTKVYEINTYNQLEENKYEYSNPNWKDQLTKFNNETITYDSIGNPLTIGNDKTLTWINGRELSSYTDSNNTINYKYNKDGIRISKEVNNVKTMYYVENGNIIFKTTGNDVIYYLRGVNSNLIGFKYNDTTYYYVKNAQDDIIGILDSNYNIVSKYEYDSCVNPISILDENGNDVSNNPSHIANINPFRYRSYYYDSKTSLYYLNSRYYSPLWGRFLNVDNMLTQSNISLLGNNLFIYSYNNSINFQDPSGHGAIWNWVKKTINKVVKATERAMIGGASTVAGLMGLSNASILLNHSLQDNPKSLNYGSGSKIAKEIKKSTDFKNTINNIASSNSNSQLDNYYQNVSFSNADLKLGLQNASMYVIGQLNNGIGNLSIVIKDTYDFEYEDYRWSQIGKLPLTFINNYAWVDQKMGIINKYDIVIQFDYCVNCR